MASFGSAAGGAFEADKHYDEMGVKHRSLDIQAAQNRFMRNQARRQDEENKRRWEIEHEDKRADRAFDESKQKAEFKAARAREKAQNEQWQADFDARKAENTQRQSNWQAEFDAEQADQQHRMKQDEFNNTILEAQQKRNQELWDRDNKVYEENRKKQQMQSDEVRAAFATAINSAITYGDDKDGMYMLKADDAGSLQVMLGNIIDGANNIVGIGVQHSQKNANGNFETLSHPNIMIYIKDASGMVIPQPMPKEKVATILDQYPQLWDAVKARDNGAYETWGKNYGYIKEPQQPPRNVALENYFKTQIETIDKQIDSYTKNGQAVPPELLETKRSVENEYRKALGLDPLPEEGNPSPTEKKKLEDVDLEEGQA